MVGYGIGFPTILNYLRTEKLEMYPRIDPMGYVHLATGDLLKSTVSRRTSSSEWRTWKGFVRCNVGLLKETGTRYNSRSILHEEAWPFPGPSDQSNGLQHFYDLLSM